MKLPISKRLLCCASMIERHSRVADVGTDHGYLPIYLLQQKIADCVLACDLREGPLGAAKRNCEKFGITEKIEFRLSDGLENVSPEEFDTLVCAGMGADLIERILKNAKWLCSEKYTLILQPQSTPQTLRTFLAENGFVIAEEKLLKEGKFFYTVMRVKKGETSRLSFGQQFVSVPLLHSQSPFLPEFLDRQEQLLSVTITGLKAAKAQDPDKLAYYETALREIQEMRKSL